MKRAILVLLAATSFIARSEEPTPVPVDELGSRFQLIGKLGAPLGTSVIVQGVLVDGPFKGYEGGPTLVIQRIGGKATQETLRICISPYFTDWGKAPGMKTAKGLPKIEKGHTYQMEGYETGGYVGIPGEAYEKAGEILQTTQHYFRTKLIVYDAKEIDPVAFSPADFVDRQALLEGTARNNDGQSIMEGPGWTISVNSKALWPQDIEGKRIEVRGLIKQGPLPGAFSLDSGTWHLVRLEDQIGKKVELRGTARSRNDNWWFRYRNVDVRVEGMEHLPGWTNANHWRPMIIRGVLHKVTIPWLTMPLQQSSVNLETFSIRDASWEPLPSLLSPETSLDE